MTSVAQTVLLALVLGLPALVIWLARWAPGALARPTAPGSSGA